jgi:hypothetical protein
MSSNLPWILGVIAVLYMMMKVFVVAHGSPNVARAVAASVGVNTLIAGIIVSGLPDLTCILLLLSVAWVIIDLLRNRMPNQLAIVSIIVFSIIGLLTAPRSQIGITALTCLNVLCVALLFSQVGSIARLSRVLTIGVVIVGIVLFALTYPSELILKAMAITAVVGAIVVISTMQMVHMYRRVHNEEAGPSPRTLLVTLGLGLIAGVALFALLPMPPKSRLSFPQLLQLRSGREYSFATVALVILPASLGYALGVLSQHRDPIEIPFLRNVSKEKPFYSNLTTSLGNVMNSTSLFQSLQGVLLGIIVIVVAAASSLGVLVSDVPWLPLEATCIQGIIPGKSTSTSAARPKDPCFIRPGVEPPKGFQYRSYVAVGYILKEEGDWTSILLDQSRQVDRFPSAAVYSRRLCREAGGGHKFFNDRPILWLSPRYEQSSLEACPSASTVLQGWIPWNIKS